MDSLLSGASAATGPAPAPAPAPARFNLTRRFSILSFVCVFAVAGVLGVLLARTISEQLLHRDAVVTMEFVQSIVRTDETAPYFGVAGAAVPPALEDSFRHFAEMPDVLRANVYNKDRRAIWSSDRNIQGRQFGDDNDELDDALEGKLVYKSGHTSKEEHVVASHPLGPRRSSSFVEIYVPVRDTKGAVVGVVELYKTPEALFEAIRASEITVGFGSFVGAMILYAALIGIVRRADAVMRDQSERLIESERLAALGEMAAAVAHSIRNPLAAIRSSVEVAADRAEGAFQEAADDITAEVDKMEAWVRELLAFSRPGSVRREPLDVNALVRARLTADEREIARRGVRVATDLAQPAPPAIGDPAVVEQVLNSLIGNALDAMPSGGTLAVSTSAHGAGAQIVINDTGTGIPTAQLEQVFKPFFTTKPRGIGLGLPLARRMVERMGGNITLVSAVGAGTSVRIALPA